MDAQEENNRRVPTHRRIPMGRRIRNDKRIWMDRHMQNERIIQYNKRMQTVTIMQTDGIMQNGKRTKTNTIFQNNKRRQDWIKMKYDKIMQNDKRMQHGRRMLNERIMQNERRIQNQKRMQHRRRMLNERIMQNERRIQNQKRMQNNRTIKNYRRFQNEKIMPNDRRIQNERRMLNVKRMHNDKKIQNDNQQVINARSMRHDRRMWVATPARIVRHNMDDTPDETQQQDDSKESGPENEQQLDPKDTDPDLNSTDPDSNSTDPDSNSTAHGSWDNFWSSMIMLFDGVAELKPPGTEAQIVRTCYIISSTYMSALKDLRRYYNSRYFYENNLHYEVGYITNEIISKYERMLEIFHIVQKRWFKYQNTEHVPDIYMLYLYTNVLEMGTVIGHLCNMLTELEDRFRPGLVPESGFADYHLPKPYKYSVNSSAQFEKAIQDYQKRLIAERKRRAKERRKLRKQNLFVGYKPTTPDRRPKHRAWPLVYGWSIEKWHW